MRAFATSLLFAAAATATRDDAGPIIGIVGLPGTEAGCDSLLRAGATSGGFSCFSTMYAKWLQQSGARTVGVPFDAFDQGIVPELLGSLSGVLFTGGGADIDKYGLQPPATGDLAAYLRTTEAIYKSVRKNKSPPLWGTCMGFQLLSILAYGNGTVLSHGFDSEDVSLPLDVTAAAKSSSLFKHVPADVWATLTESNSTANLHHDGVSPAHYSGTGPLAAAFDLLASGKDRKGRPFGAVMEAADGAPVWATQFHPERPQFEFTPGHGFNHTFPVVRAMQWMSGFFVSQTYSHVRPLSDSATEWLNQHVTDTLTTRDQGGDSLGMYRVFVY